LGCAAPSAVGDPGGGSPARFSEGGCAAASEPSASSV
jgi:hypothetical protein